MVYKKINGNNYTLMGTAKRGKLAKELKDELKNKYYSVRTFPSVRNDGSLSETTVDLWVL
jgi:hypothetical protein